MSRSVGPVTATRLPSGATASGTAYSSAGFFPAASVLDLIVDTFGHASHVFTAYPDELPKITLRAIAGLPSISTSGPGTSGNHATASGAPPFSSIRSPGLPVAVSRKSKPSFVVTASRFASASSDSAAKWPSPLYSHSRFRVAVSNARTCPPLPPTYSALPSAEYATDPPSQPVNSSVCRSFHAPGAGFAGSPSGTTRSPFASFAGAGTSAALPGKNPAPATSCLPSGRNASDTIGRLSGKPPMRRSSVPVCASRS